ncbi:MAG: hypothetical protein M1828_005633 [Chrysothrix sp. TS-e1954]|nr:MAG: hypothetical protein M1828_005633 [Chrysothrix sp. TS-e1954]
MSDIRSFFGGKQAPPAPKQNGTANAKKEAPKSRGRRKILDDSDDEEAKPTPKKATPKKPETRKRQITPEGEATTTSEYFANSKAKKPTAAKTEKAPTKPVTPIQTPTKTPKSTSATHAIRTSSRTKQNGTHINSQQLDGINDEAGDDVFKPGDDVEMRDASISDNKDEEVPTKKRGRPAKSNGNKRKSPEPDEDEATPPKKAARKSPPKKTLAKSPRAKKTEEPDNGTTQAIMDSIPLVRPPSPPAPDTGDKSKFQFGGQHANSGPAPAAGSVEIPTGAENCLVGLSFVFTGLLETINRDDGQALVKRYGGKVVGAPSSKTSYVVLGSDAGPSKIRVIREKGIKTIDEKGLFELIRRMPANGGDSRAAEKFEEQKAKEQELIEKQVADMEAEERKAKKAAKDQPPSASQGARANDKAPAAGPDTRLWTVKHAPTQLSQICGNKTQVEKLQKWLRLFPKNQRTKFSMAGPDGSGVYRAVIIHGPPGIGKTTAAHLVAKSEGYDVVESNASDARSKKLVEAGLKGVLSTTSLLGYFAADGKQVEAAKKKVVLIMDEVDGMSAGDRGGVGALAAVCKKSQVPMILICNDRKLPKMKPFDFCTYELPFRRPTVDNIRSRIATIAHREGVKLPVPVMNALIEGTGADIRQIVNMISTVKLDQEAAGMNMDFDAGKKMSKAWEKHIVLRPWDIVSKILGGGLFAASSKATLNEKSELYFNDHEFSPLMLQENYLGTNPILSNDAGTDPKKKNKKVLELVDKAASSISDGDLVDRMIHGSEQHWSLMPTHAIFSFVRPASFVSGSMAGHGQTRFTQWLGKNSSQGKTARQIKEIQGHMRLRASGDRHEIRQQYLPLLWSHLIGKLEKEGKESVPEAIELMDHYYLTRDDWEAIYELGVGPIDQESHKLETQTKATFTRLYNAQAHPLPFIKASAITQPKKIAKEKPDLEEALEESDEAEVVEDEPKAEDEEEDVDLSKDKYVKQPKKKKAPAKGKAAATAGGKEEDGEDDIKPAKGKGKGKGRAKK